MNKKTKQIIFVIITILALIKFAFLFITGQWIGIVIFASWMVWLSFIVGLILMWFLYGWAFKALYSLKFIIILWLSVGILLCIIGFSTGAVRFGNSANVNTSASTNSANQSKISEGASKTSSSAKLVKCLFDATSPITNASGFTAEMFASPLNAGRSYTEGVKTETRVFSLSDYADEKANPIKDYKNPIEKTTLKEDIFYHVTTPGYKPYPGTMTGQIQICDKNNMSFFEVPKNPNVLEKDAIGFGDSVHSVNLYSSLPSEPGEYRVDGLLYVDGKWYLTNRVEITLTK